jgi:hypothetical protein
MGLAGKRSGNSFKSICVIRGSIMADKRKTRNIAVSVAVFEYNEILMYARIKGHGGENPVSNFAHYAVFQQMKRYPLKPAEIDKYLSEYGKGTSPSKAVQPCKPQANKKTPRKAK